MVDKRIRFIREEPVFAQSFRGIYFGLVSKELHDWFWDWVEDIGRTLRSREYMLSVVTGAIYMVGINAIARLLGISKVNLLQVFLESLGVRVGGYA